MRESLTPSRLKPASPVARRAVQLCGRGLGVTRPVTVAPTSIISRGTRPRRRIAIAILGCSLLQRCKRWVAADGQGVTGSICGCCKSAFCTRALHEVGDLEQARSTRASQSRLSRFDILGASRRMAVGRATPRRRRARDAPGPRRRHRGRESRRRRAKRTRRPRRTARSRSGPTRTPSTDPEHDSEIPRESNGPPSWRRRGAVVLRLSPSSGADENQSTRRRGGRGSPRTTVTRLGRRGAIRRAAQPQSTAVPCPRRRAAPTARAARAKREA